MFHRRSSKVVVIIASCLMGYSVQYAVGTTWIYQCVPCTGGSNCPTSCGGNVFECPISGLTCNVNHPGGQSQCCISGILGCSERECGGSCAGFPNDACKCWADPC